MPTGASIAALDHLFKRTYPQARITSTTLKNNTFLDRVKKDSTHQGSIRVLPISYAGPQGHGDTVANAQANASSTLGQKAHYDVGEYFSVQYINDKTIKAARSDMGSFARVTEQQVKELLVEHGNDLSIQAWGDGGGSRGQRGSVSGSTCTLKNASDINRIEVGMVLTASSASGALSGATQRSGSTTVTSVDYQAGAFDFSGTITSWADDDYLFRQYMFAGDVSQSRLMKGIQAHCTAATPTTSLHNVDRTLSGRLHGVILPAAREGGNYQELFEEYAEYAFTTFGSTPGDFYVNPRHWTRISRQLQNGRETRVKNDTGTFGYNALEFTTPYGSANIVADRHCPIERSYPINHDHIKIISMGELTNVMDGDGITMLRTSDSNDYERRYLSYAEVQVDKPCAHGSFTLPAL